MAVIDELVAILGFKVEGQEKLKGFNDQLDKTEKNASALNARLVAVGAAAGAAFAAGMVKLGASVIKTSAQFEGYKTTLATIEGSQAKAQKSFEWLTKFATRTPFEIAELTQSFVKLKAYGIDPIADGTMGVLGDSASAMGKTLNDAVEMVADATTFSFERMKEFGITSSTKGDEVTFSWQKNGETLTKTVKKNGEEIRKFVLDNLGSRFGGAMIAQSKTWGGMVSNLADTWTMFQAKIGDSGFFGAVKERLSRLMGWLEGLADDGTLTRIAQGISDAFTGSMDFVEKLGGYAWDVGKAFYYAADGILSTVAAIAGLSKGTAAAGIIGGAAIATVSGRKALMAVASRIPAVAALLALEDIISGLRGGESLVGSTEEGAEALARLQKAGEELGKAWSDLLGQLTGTQREFSSFMAEIKSLFGWNPESTWMTILTGELQKFAEDLRGLVQDITAAVNAVRSAIDIVQGGDGDIRTNEERSAVGDGAKPRAQPGAPKRKPANTDASVSDDTWDYRQQLAEEEVHRVNRSGAGFTGAGINSQNAAKIVEVLQRVNSNIARMTPDNAVEAVVTDARVANDNRQFPVSNNVTVNQTVQQASQAPAAAARATGNAVASSAAQQSRIAAQPTTSGNGPQ